jgi:imidazolonepropionase-like amidohydrolase
VVGKRADLMIVDADPLADIRNTHKIFAVYHNGRSVADVPAGRKALR